MKKKVIGFLSVFAVLAICMPVFVFSGDLSLLIENPDGKKESTSTILLSFDTKGEALGAFHLELSYDPEELQVQTVQAGNSPYFSKLISKIDNTRGAVNISAFQGVSMNEPSGSLILTRLRFVPKGTSAEENPFSLKKAEFLSPQGAVIPVQ